MSGVPEILWLSSPLVFAAGLALIYARDRAIRVAGFFLGIFALVLASDLGDADNFFLAVVACVVGVVVFIVRPPAWWFQEDEDHPT
ncbi:MAG: hypothetical protein WD066_00060 [Planctomycetaceae bacterium]